MASLKLEHIYKVYPNGTKAVNDFSLDIKNGEFIVFVGPSGCGKSTTLRMIAGLEEITAGELYIDANIVNDMEPKDRDIAMVFQNYALYPHMTVYENMAFGLKLRHVPEDVIQEKVLWAADVLGIKEYLDRKPRNMSGGQRQRVSLGRAILRDPKVMLLDEPLSNLDAKLRAQMRTEIAKLHQKLKTTFIYVTHDQTEAMTLGDRVVVMKKGRIQQVDTPKNLYNYPGNKFVAGFIGTPQMNFLDCTLLREGDNVKIHLDSNNKDLVVSYNYLIKVLPEYLDGKHSLTLGVRCEHVKLSTAEDANAIKLHISHFEELGSECLIYGNVSNQETIDSTDGDIILKVDSIEGLETDTDIYVTFDMDHIYFFDNQSEMTIIPRIPEYNSLTATIDNGKLSFLNVELDLPQAIATSEHKEGELRVPTNCLTLNAESGFNAEVVSNEHIGETNLVHLKAADRVFFAISDMDYEVGSTVKVGVDFTRLTMIDKEGNVVFAPIAERDSFFADFLNYETVVSENNNPEYKQFRDEKIKAAADFVDAQIVLEQNEYNNKKLEIENKDVAAEFAKKQEEFNQLVEKNNILIGEKKTKFNEEYSALKTEFIANKKEAKAKNNELFAEKKAKEEADFKAFKLNNKDKGTLKRRTDEYHIFKDNFQLDKENTLNRIINGLTMDYESKSSALRAGFKREINLLKKEIKEAKAELNVAKDPLKALEKSHKEKMADLEKKKAAAIKRAGFIFFFQFNSSYFKMASDIISNKLIQGLGTRVFTKNFRIDMPHDAYTITDKSDEFKAKVEENLDYGNVYFVKLSYLDEEGKTKYLFLKNPSALEIGKEVYLSFDITKSQITETDMNIRLY